MKPIKTEGTKMHNLLLDTLPIWTTAQAQKTSNRGVSASNQQLLGIQKLRELILELAVRGKLVPQDPNDEPASELMKRIEAEKEKLKREKKIRKQEPFIKSIKKEKPFELPFGWEWAYLGEIGNIFNGNSISSKIKEEKYTNIEKGLPFIATKDVKYGWETLDYNNGISIPINEKGFNVAHKGAVFICAEGGSAGKKCGITNQDVCFGNKLFAIELFGSIIPKYVLSYYLCPTFFSSFSMNMTGIIGGIALSKFIQLQIPLPPIAEQHRIVAKVDELMALCDELEKEQTNSNATHETLLEVLLTNLTDAKNSDDFKEAWQRIAGCFDTLFTTEYSIDKLKQTILQLAVMGKLVPQDPTDEPASELLKKIAKEKARLIKEGKIKKQSTLPEITEEEKPFELPIGWEWVRMGYLINIKSELVNPLNYPDLDQVAPDSIEKKTGKLLFRRTVSESGVRGPNNKFYVGQILYSKIRPSLSKAIIAPFDGICSADMYPIESMINPEFLLKEILSENFLNQVKIVENRIKMPKLNALALLSIIVTLPPLAEQHRIVTKVNELFAICDSLKEGIHKAQEIQNVLAEEIVKRIVN